MSADLEKVRIDVSKLIKELHARGDVIEEFEMHIDADLDLSGSNEKIIEGAARFCD